MFTNISVVYTTSSVVLSTTFLMFVNVRHNDIYYTSDSIPVILHQTGTNLSSTITPSSLNLRLIDDIQFVNGYMSIKKEKVSFRTGHM